MFRSRRRRVGELCAAGSSLGDRLRWSPLRAGRGRQQRAASNAPNCLIYGGQKEEARLNAPEEEEEAHRKRSESS